MKKFTVALAATGLLALAACNKTPEAQNVIDAGDNAATALANTTDAMGNEMEATADNAVNAMGNAAEATTNAADAVKAEATNAANAM